MDLQHILGFRVKITNLIDGVTEGKIYSFNSSNGTITLQTAKKGNSIFSFKVIKFSFIKRLDVIDKLSQNNMLGKQQLNPNYVNIERIRNLLRDVLDDQTPFVENIDYQITHEGKTIFDILSNTLPQIEWKGRDIIALQYIKILYPYNIENIIQLEESDNNNSLQLVKKIVERGWTQIKEDNGRKGG